MNKNNKQKNKNNKQMNKMKVIKRTKKAPMKERKVKILMKIKINPKNQKEMLSLLFKSQILFMENV